MGRRGVYLNPFAHYNESIWAEECPCVHTGALTSKLLTRKPDLLFDPVSAVPYLASSAMLSHIQRTLSSQALRRRIKGGSRCAPACVQGDFMRLLLARKPDPFFDTVSVVLYLASSAMLGRIELHQYRAVVDAALARGGMVSSNSNIWKGLSLLTVRQHTCSVLKHGSLRLLRASGTMLGHVELHTAL